MSRLLELPCNPKSYSPAALAFIGDAVYSLLSRESLLCQGNCPSSKLHSQSVRQVRCEAQSQALELIFPLLTDNEQDICRRGRNLHTTHTPKNSSTADYHNATALEALFGWLYINGSTERIRELFNVITQNNEQERL